MKIAVTYENGQVFQHFGHTEFFKVYEVEEGKVVSAEVVDTNGSGHGALAGVLVELGVDTLICGGIGGGARNALGAVGITIYGGVSGDADAAVAALGGGIYGTDFEKSYINKVMVGKAGGETVGYVISATSGDGFDGDIVMSIGLDLNGVVTGVEFTEISETAGMGMLVTESKFKDQYIGDDVDSFVVNKAGGSTEPNQIDSVSGATISSRAVTNAVNAARDFFAANVK